METSLCLTSWGGGCPHVSPQLWSWSAHPVRSYGAFWCIHFVPMWPWSLTSWPWSHVTWCHLGVQCLCQVWDVFDLPSQSNDDYNFPLTASWKSKFSRFFGGKGGQISNFIFLTPKRHFLGAWGKSVLGSWSCGGSKIALPHWQGPWLIQQLVLPWFRYKLVFVFRYGCSWGWFS